MASRNDHQRSGWDDFELVLTAIISLAWRWRTELGFLASLYASFLLLAHVIGTVGAQVTLGLAVSTLLIAGPTRRWIIQRFYAARMRRRWELAARDIGLCAPNGRVPRVRKARRVPAGDLLLVRVPRGGSVPEIDKAAETMAAAIGIRDVRVVRDPSNASFAEVTLVKYHFLGETTHLRWPHESASRLSLWDPIPVGIDDEGEPVSLRLVERNVLIGGEPGAGKSAALSLLVATAALDPSVKLWLLDGKQVELAAWSPIAEESVGPSLEEAIDLLRSLQQEMEKRYERLLAGGLRKVSRGDGLPLHMVVCDELAFYLTLSHRKQRNEFADLMRDLVSRGRAAGIIVVAATQKPSHDIIPTSLRDLFGFRWAMRCNTPQASDTVLGSGWASLDFSASQIPGDQRGVGLLLSEGEQPVRLKSFYIDDQQLEQLATRAQRLRADKIGRGLAA